MGRCGPMGSRFLPRFRVQIRDPEAAQLCGSHLSDRCDRDLRPAGPHRVSPECEDIIRQSQFVSQ